MITDLMRALIIYSVVRLQLVAEVVVGPLHRPAVPVPGIQVSGQELGAGLSDTSGDQRKRRSPGIPRIP